jgi:hypothetical protein
MVAIGLDGLTGLFHGAVHRQLGGVGIDGEHGIPLGERSAEPARCVFLPDGVGDFPHGGHGPVPLRVAPTSRRGSAWNHPMTVTCASSWATMLTAGQQMSPSSAKASTTFALNTAWILDGALALDAQDLGHANQVPSFVYCLATVDS